MAAITTAPGSAHVDARGRADGLTLPQLLGHSGDGVRHPRGVGRRHHTGSPVCATTRFCTVRPPATTAPARSTDPRTRAPASTRHPGPTTESITRAPGAISGGRVDQPARRHLLEVGVEVALGCADVAPGAVEAPRIQARSHEERKHLVLDRHGSSGRNQIEHAGVDDVGARVDRVGGCFPGRRLLDERGHGAVGRGDDHAVAAGIVHRVQRQGHAGAVVAMKGVERGQVEVGQDVAVCDHERLPKAAGRVRDRASGAQWLGLHHVLERIPEMGPDRIGAVAARQDDADRPRAGAGARPDARGTAGWRWAAWPWAPHR